MTYQGKPDSTGVLSVTQLNEYVKALLETNPLLGRVSVRGEISNFKNHIASGHLYFSLKDEGGTVNAVMFRSDAARLRFQPENGMRVLVTGRLSAYVKTGQYQIYCNSMLPDGAGALAIAFEQLKRRLEAEGLFDTDKKKPLPRYPKKIGIITSPTGAALRDMIQVTGRRFPSAQLILFPSLVQGDGAAAQLTEGIRYFHTRNDIDVIIIGRGGGSMEDLWCFNDESLVRAVAASRIPVISAVGHEVDFTLCDFAADRRAPTPSAAAELAVPDKTELLRRLANNRIALLSDIGGFLADCRSALSSLASRKVMSSPLASLEDRRMRLLNDERLLTYAADKIKDSCRRRYVAQVAKLDALNPMKVISRGYAAVFTEDGTLIRSVSQVRKNQELRLRLGDGSLRAAVTDKEEN